MINLVHLTIQLGACFTKTLAFTNIHINAPIDTSRCSNGVHNDLVSRLTLSQISCFSDCYEAASEEDVQWDGSRYGACGL
ncbi:hypothetical protein BJ912DRAFT_986887 [Pholiota molesta]|nr:hypothetical protein BJ912DRAFT_986887 [Pholiota molesta]